MRRHYDDYDYIPQHGRETRVNTKFARSVFANLCIYSGCVIVGALTVKVVMSIFF